MSKKLLYIAWAGLYILCAALGFLSQPQGFVQYLMTALSVLFFLPGALLLAQARKERDRASVMLIRNLALASLILTVLALVANFLSVLGSSALGDALYAALVILSSPMVCSGYWLLSLFLWACLLAASLELLRKMK